MEGEKRRAAREGREERQQAEREGRAKVKEREWTVAIGSMRPDNSLSSNLPPVDPLIMDF